MVAMDDDLTAIDRRDALHEAPARLSWVVDGNDVPGPRCAPPPHQQQAVAVSIGRPHRVALDYDPVERPADRGDARDADPHGQDHPTSR